MLNWETVKNGLFQAVSENGFFKYVIEPIDGQFSLSLWIDKTLIQKMDRLGPFLLHEAKDRAQSDYDARITVAKDIEDGRYSR